MPHPPQPNYQYSVLTRTDSLARLSYHNAAGRYRPQRIFGASTAISPSLQCPWTPIYSIVALNPAALITFASSSVLTASLRTLITARAGRETAALITFWCCESASCTLVTHPPHVIPVTVKVTSSLAVASIGTDINAFNSFPDTVSNTRIFPSKPPAASCLPFG